MRYLLLTLTFVLVGHVSATGEINVLTDLQSPFPPGCVAVSLPQDSASSQNELFDDDITIPSVQEDQPAATVRVQIWRTGCHDSGFSVVMVRLEKVGGGPVLVPRAYAEAGQVEFPGHQAQLIRHPAVGGVGASGNELVGATTYMLGVDPFPLDADSDTTFSPDEYNDQFTLELYWGDYAGANPLEDYLLLEIDAYLPELDPTQDPFQVLHGRMSGQYVVEGLPNSGVVLQIGEVYNQGEPDTNSVSVLFFTYLNGEPFWVVGGKVLDPGFDIVELEMLELGGGEFITSPPGSYDEDDISTDSIGTMTLEAIDCNRLLITYEFDEGGLGSGQFEADRLVNLAGHTCNPWR